MNILTIIVLAVFALCIFDGYRKGFLKTAFSLVSWVIVLVLCDYATPMVTTAIVENTDIEIAVQSTVDAKLSEMITDALENSGVSELEATLPAELKTAILGDGASLQEVIASGAPLDTSALVNGIIGILGFVITVAILRVLMMVVELALGIVAKLPLIGPIDKLLGLACGVGSGVIWCWVILAIVSVLALTGTNTELATYVSQSQLLTWLQDNNLLLNLIVNIQ